MASGGQPWQRTTVENRVTSSVQTGSQVLPCLETLFRDTEKQPWYGKNQYKQSTWTVLSTKTHFFQTFRPNRPLFGRDRIDDEQQFSTWKEVAEFLSLRVFAIVARKGLAYLNRLPERE